VCVCVCMHVCM